MKKRFLTFIFTITAMLTCIFGLSACGKVDFKVNFVVDGEVYATLNTNGEEVIKMPENPTKDDYVFDGWYWDKDTWQTPFTANSLLDAPLSSDMNVYCKWKPNTIPVETITLDKTEITLHENDVAYLTAIVTPNNATEKGVTWHSSDSSVAQVENGTVTAVGYGTATITVTTLDGNKTATCIVEVVEDKITFNTLSVDGESVYGKVSNSTTTFSFIREIEEHGNATVQVYKEITCQTLIASKTIDLKIGDNTVYVLQTVGRDLKLYTVTVRRRPVYNVTFDTNGGAAVQSQQVEEDGLASQPTTTKTGYTFSCWNYDFASPITQDIAITAIWTANKDTKYQVEYYLQNLADDDYTLETTENKTGTTDTTANAEIKTFAHFTYKAGSSESGNVNGDGSTVLKVYYTRNTYTVTFDGNGGTLISGSECQTVKYGGSVTAPEYKKTGYSFNGYDKTNYTNIGDSFTVTAQWAINQYALTVVYGNGQGNKVITQDYNTPIEITNPERAGYGFAGWDKTLPTTMPAENLTVTAMWNSIFTLSEGTITGLTDYGKNNYTKLIIPSQIDGAIITAIGSSAFENCSSLTSVTIPNSVTSIGSYAFNNCSSLTGVYITDISAWCNISFGNYYANPLCYAHNLYLNSELVTELVIPDGVTSIGWRAFYGCSSLTSVTIPNSVTSIGEYAFNHCSSLMSVYITDITAWCKISFGSYGANPLCFAQNLYLNNELVTELVIPDGVTSIGEYAFYYCSSLIGITIPNSVTSIGSYAFSNCSSITSITIPDSVIDICGYAFSNCGLLRSVSIGKNVGNIGSGAFADCASLITVNWDATNCRIEWDNASDYLFKNCTKLTTICIGETVTNIPRLAFKIDDSSSNSKILNLYYDGDIMGWCNIKINGSYFQNGYNLYIDKVLLDNLVLPDNITDIGDYTFSSCVSITSVTIPDGVTRIGFSAFFGCSRLTSVTIGNSVTRIGSYAFEYCRSLTSVTIPDSVKIIGTAAFENCSSLTSVTIPNSVTSIGSFAFYNCSSLTSVTIGNSVTSIGSDAFRDCYSLTSVTIPDSVTSIGSYAFRGCRSLEEITIPFVGAVAGKTESDTYQYPFGYIFGTSSYTGGTAVRQYYYGSSTSSTTNTIYYIPSSLKKVTVTGGNILYGAFYNCGSLTSVTIPDGVKSIGTAAFENCSSLTSVTIPNSVTSIGEYAFSCCSSLTSITIPDSVTSIGSGAFSGCVSLEEITIPFVGAVAGKTESDTYQYPFGYIFGTSSYTGGTAVQQCYYGSSTSSTTYSTYCIPSSLRKVTVTGGNILYSAFYGCRNLTSVTIPNNVTSIGDWAFYYCSGLTSITIPDGVKTIGYETFYNCSSLASVTIGNGVTSIGNWAFYNCRSLTSITIPNSVTSIGSYAFYDCRSLTSITFSDTTTWYRTTDYTYWQNKSGGTQTGVTNSSQNATYFKSTYYNYYWYKK